MSVFIDTGVYFAHHDKDAARHEDARNAFDAVLTGQYGQPYTSEYVLDEAVTLTRMRTGSFRAAKTIADRIRGEGEFPTVVEMLFIDQDDLTEALTIFREYQDHSLSFTDATTIQLCERHGIDTVLSFDSDFDGIVDLVETPT